MIAASSPCTIACEIEKTTPQIKTTKAVKSVYDQPRIVRCIKTSPAD